MLISKSDSCLFYYHENGKLKGILLMHVDDLLSCGTANFQTNVMNKLRQKNIYLEKCQEIILNIPV